MSEARDAFEKDLGKYFEAIESEDEFAPLDASINVLQGSAVGKLLGEHQRYETTIYRLKSLLTNLHSDDLTEEARKRMIEIINEALE